MYKGNTKKDYKLVAANATNVLKLITSCSYAGGMLLDRDQTYQVADLVTRSVTLARSPLR